MPNDDDPADDWKNAPITPLDGQITPASGIDGVIEEARKRGHVDGCRTCFPEGQNDAVQSFAKIMRRHGLTETEIVHIVAAAREQMRKV